MKNEMPKIREMYQAVVNRDSSYVGIFYLGVKTTGVFCRPGCRARIPKLENIEFFSSAKSAFAKGYRPCKVCKPTNLNGTTPPWINRLISEIEIDRSKKWSDEELKLIGIDPAGVRRWFKKNYNMTFHNYVRKIRLSNAITEMKNGETMTQAAFAQGYESLSGFIDAMKSFTGKTPGESKNVKFLSVDKINTLLGPMIACAMDDGIYLLEFEDRRMLKTQMKRIIRGNKVVPVLSKHKYIKQIEEELHLYFEGKLSEFKTPFKMTGTEFQKSVWNQLLKIPFGETICYEELAARIGNPTAQRAVANANGFNAIGIVIPCHRVIGKDGNLRGYGGKVWRKKKLLDLERESIN